VIKKEDYLFAIGFEGNTAMVDGRAKRKYARYSAKRLADEGLFKPAVCAALYDGDQKALQEVQAVYNSKAQQKVDSEEELKRVLGIYETPEKISRVTVY
jgi:hypothetical protein